MFFSVFLFFSHNNCYLSILLLSVRLMPICTLIEISNQGRRRDFESGPAERSAEGTTGGRAREGGLPPSRLGGGGGWEEKF